MAEGKNVSLQDLELDSKIISAAKRGGYLNAEQILSNGSNQISFNTGLSSLDVDLLVQVCVKNCLPSNDNVLSISKSDSLKYVISPTHYGTGVPNLDTFLGGGFPSRGIVEICGESGSGKTQFGLQLALLAQLPKKDGGLGTRVAYICTESPFPVGRLKQLITERFGLDEDGDEGKCFTNKIFVHHVSDLDDFLECILYILPELIARKKIGLVIIDSIASVFRVFEGLCADKNNGIQKVGRKLHELAHCKNVGVITLNQVTSNMNKDSLYGLSESCIMPSLGLSWSSFVTTRLMLFKTNYCIRPENLKSLNIIYRIRNLQIVFCPWLERKKIPFVITNKGIEDIDINHPNVCLADS